jgi:hypothetical protein
MVGAADSTENGEAATPGVAASGGVACTPLIFEHVRCNPVVEDGKEQRSFSVDEDDGTEKKQNPSPLMRKRNSASGVSSFLIVQL